MNFEGFNTLTFPRDEGIVYVLCFKRDNSLQEAPFYVGESGRGTRRLNDYITAQFAAATDFKVGVVIAALQEAGAEVIVKYKACANRKAEEAALIKEAGTEHLLLNNVPSFNYRTASKEDERERFKHIALALLESNAQKAGPGE